MKENKQSKIKCECVKCITKNYIKKLLEENEIEPNIFVASKVREVIIELQRISNLLK